MESDCTVIMHQANCFKSMTGGIAKAISESFPNARIADEELNLSPSQKYGHFSYARSQKDFSTVIIANLYGQFNPGPFQTKEEKYERVHMLHQAISSFFFFALTNGINLSKVGVPYKMGCGISGGDWKEISSILEELSEKYQVDLYVYQLD